MTLFKPTLTISRLLVKRNADVVYDQSFHNGINVIRGENSSGKSTVLNFIFYGLGGDLRDWSDIAELCTDVFLGVELNGNPATLRREVSSEHIMPMEVFGGKISDGLEATRESWLSYPYKRSSQRESFSQALFRLLEMPDVANEASGNVTMHQVLRVLYADQLSRIEDIFRQEVFDTSDLRENVGNLLCGAYNNEVYEKQQLLKAKRKSFEEVSAEFRSILSIIGGDEGIGTQWIETQRQNLESDRENKLAELSDAERSYYESEKGDKITLKAQNDVFKKVQKLQTKLLETRRGIERVELDVTDSADFIEHLEHKIARLREASTISELFKTIEFSSCPACYSEVINELEEISACPLCKTPYDKERAGEKIVSLINEATIQLAQSRILQEKRANNLTDLKAQEQRWHDEWKIAAKELQLLQSRPTTTAREKIRAITRNIGYIDRQLEDLESKLKLASKIQSLAERKEALSAEITRIQSQIDLLKSKQTEKLIKAHNQIEKYTIELLKRDLKRQDTFENPESLTFSFSKNKITVDEHSYFSASSRVILKTSFLLGFLTAALKNPDFRHPRFLMIDITENNGMEMERSHNLQDLMMDISKNSRVAHQIIYATAFPSPNIPQENFVGLPSTRDNRTLKLKASG